MYHPPSLRYDAVEPANLARDARAAPAASAHLAALLADPEALADPLALDSRGRRSRPRAPPRHTST